jgi:hypothetical protein
MAKTGGAMNSPDGGLSLAYNLLDRLSQGDDVRLDFDGVGRITPSFSNAFVMTLLQRLSLEGFRARIQMVNQNAGVQTAIAESIRLYESGVRLSTQRQATSPT